MTAPSGGRLRLTLGLIRFEHTLFALPFAFAGSVLAAGGWPGGRVALLVLVAMVGARSAAMAFNRLVDEPYDRLNPRTRERALPSGRLGRGYVAGVVAAGAALFLGAAALLNFLTLLLAPAALAVVLLYSYTKRFTTLSHLVLGLALALAPAGGWVAVTGQLDWRVGPLSLAVLLWVAGFDILYACQDEDFDRRVGLHSLPARLGAARALLISRLFHGGTVAALLAAWYAHQLAWPTLAGLAGLAILLVAEHRLVAPGDLARLQTAFFTLNAVFSVGLLGLILVDLALTGGRPV